MPLVPGFAAVLFLAVMQANADEPAVRVDQYGDPLPAGAVARLGSIYLHNPARQIQFAADGKTFHGAAAGPAVVVWDAATGKRLRVIGLPGLDGSWPWLCADGSTAVAEQPGGVHHVLDVRTGKVRVVLPRWAEFKHIDDPFSPDGRFVAAFDKPYGTTVAQSIHVWDTTTGKTWCLGQQGDVMCQLGLSPGGKRLVAHSGGAATCWDVAAGKQLWQTKPVHLTRRAFAFSPDGRMLVVEKESRTGGTVELWDATTGKPPVGVKPLAADIRSHYGFTPDGQALQVSDRTTGSGLWDIRRGALRVRWPGRWGGRFDPTGKTLLETSWRINRWDLATGKQMYTQPDDRGNPYWISDVVFDPTGRRVFTAEYGNVCVWEPKTGRLVRALHFPRGGYSRTPTLAISRDGRRLLLDVNDDGFATNSFTILNPDTGRTERRIACHNYQSGPHSEHYGHPNLSPDGSIVRVARTTVHHQPSGDDRSEILGWNLDTGQLLAPIRFEFDQFYPGSETTISSDGRLLCDGRGVFDTASGKRLVPLSAAGAQGYGSSAFSDDGRFVAVRVAKPRGKPADLPQVQVWDTLTGKPVARVTVGADRMRLTPNGRFLVTLDATGVSAWDLLTGRQVVHHRANPRGLYYEGQRYTSALAVAPDGRTAITGRNDGTCLVWDFSAAYRAVVKEPPDDAAVAAAWDALGDADGSRAFAAMWQLVGCPERTIPFLRAD
jgi:WD40 repeat protein